MGLSSQHNGRNATELQVKEEAYVNLHQTDFIAVLNYFGRFIYKIYKYKIVNGLRTH